MTLALIALAAGLAAGYARGGRLATLAAVHPRRNRLLLTAVGLHVAGVLGSWWYAPLLMICAALSWLTFAYYAWLNRAIQGASLVAAGLAANAFVLLANGAVPVSPDAAARAGADPASVVAADNHEAIGPDTQLAWLGKVVPVAFPPRPEVVSPGDIAVAAGLATILAMGMTGPRLGRPREHARLDELEEPVGDLQEATTATEETDSDGQESPQAQGAQR